MLKNARLIAERYAQALTAAMRDDAEVGKVRDDLAQLAAVADRSPELRRALTNPVIEAGAKLLVLKSLAAKMHAQPATLRFLEVLASHDRLSIFRDVVDAVGRALDARSGVVEVEIRSAAPLDDAVRQRLAGVLARVAGKRIRTREIVDAEILGGLVVTVGGTVYDGSVKSRLEELRSRLTGQMVGV